MYFIVSDLCMRTHISIIEHDKNEIKTAETEPYVEVSCSVIPSYPYLPYYSSQPVVKTDGKVNSVALWNGQTPRWLCR